MRMWCPWPVFLVPRRAGSLRNLNPYVSGPYVLPVRVIDVVVGGLLCRVYSAFQTAWLDGKHVVFGKVIEGMDVVKVRMCALCLRLLFLGVLCVCALGSTVLPAVCRAASVDVAWNCRYGYGGVLQQAIEAKGSQSGKTSETIEITDSGELTV